MTSLSYAIRGADGVVVRGQTADFGDHAVPVRSASNVSLNIAPSDIVSYKIEGSDLVIELANGEFVTLEGYFAGEMAPERELFLSRDGEFHSVELGQPTNNEFFATYDGVDLSGKWSQYDELTFLDLDRVEPVVAPLAAPLLGLGGAAGAAGAAVVGAAALAGGGGGSSDPSAPTVDDAEVDRIIGGTADNAVVVTGTGLPGSTVEVTVGGVTSTTTVDDDGIWRAEFAPEDLPADGKYDSSVHVIAPDGTEYDLAGPVVDIDTTPPEVDVTEGTQSVGEIVNAEEQADGHIISGTGEASATVAVEIDGTTHTTTVAEDGTWSVEFAAGEIATGEYEQTVTLTTTDIRGNSQTTTEVLVVDTIAPAIDMAAVTGDNLINAQEASSTVALNGTGEAGATLVVEFQGQTYNTTVGDNGTWSVNVPSAAIAEGTYESEIKLTATDAAGNATSESFTVQIDTEGAVTLTTPIEGDGVVNAAEQSDGVALAGTAEAGSSVEVTMHNVTKTVTADADGNWTANFSSTELPAGEYDADISVKATDAAGNVSTTDGSVHVDTQTSVEIDNGLAGGDNLANANEVLAGISLTGDAEPGASVVVSLQGVEKTVTAGADGSWSANYNFSEIPQGEYDAAVSVTSTDAAGNTATATSTLRVDTELSVAIDANQAGGDDIANADEVAAGLTLTGTADAGAQVVVNLHGANETVTAGSDGTWSATFASSRIAQGEYTANVTVTATDAAGNVDTSHSTVEIDTSTTTSIAVQQATATGSVNASDIKDGVVLDGTAEAGAQISVLLNGETRTTVANESGYWSVSFDEGTLPTGEYSATAIVTSTDAAGNTATAPVTFSVDTDISETLVTDVTFNNGNTSRLTVQTTEDDYTINSLNANGTTSELTATETSLGAEETLFSLTPHAPDGTHLVVEATDTAGNESDTLVILDADATNSGTLSHAGIGEFSIEGIELDYADNASLTLTEAQIRDLSDTSDTLTIHGGRDDEVEVTGAVDTGQTTQIDGETYDIYTVGDDGVTLVIDQDINVII